MPTAIVPSTAIVLAGGLGTRLRSVVSDVPKPLAPIHGRPFLAYLLDYLGGHGIRRVTLAVGYRGGQVEEGFGESHGPLALTYSYEDEPLGTGGAVRQALNVVNADEPAWVINGDTFFACDLGACAKTHRDATADVTLALKRVAVADRYGLVEVGDSGLVDRFREKRPGAGGLINAGVYLLEPGALLRFDLPAPAFSLERDFLEAHLLDLRVAASVQDGYFVDIGIPEDYARAQAYFGGVETSDPR